MKASVADIGFNLQKCFCAFARNPSFGCEAPVSPCRTWPNTKICGDRRAEALIGRMRFSNETRREHDE